MGLEQTSLWVPGSASLTHPGAPGGCGSAASTTRGGQGCSLGFRLFLKQDNGLGASQVSPSQHTLCASTGNGRVVPLPPQPVGDMGLAAVAQPAHYKYHGLSLLE